MKNFFLILSFFWVLLSSCNNVKKNTPCNCSSLRYDNLYNHFYQVDRAVGFTGKCIEKYANGQMKTIRHIVNGKNNGTYKLYYSSGQLKESGTFKDNLQHGIRKIYDEKGNLIAKEKYVYGQIKSSL